MAADLTSEAWAKIRHDYEHTERPIEDICLEHGISSGTLRDRMRRWNWTRRRPLVPSEGPPAAPAPQIDPLVPTSPATVALDVTPSLVPAPPVAAGEEACAPAEPDDKAIVPRLQSAVARVLRAIEATAAQLGAGHPREMERAARALAALTRTLRELNGLLSQHHAPAANDPADDDPIPRDMDAFRYELARRMNAFVEARTGTPAAAPKPQGS